MSTVAPAVEAPRRPKLEVALERLLSVSERLHSSTVSYQQVKALLMQAQQPGFDPSLCNVQMQLQIGDICVAMPPPTDIATYLQNIEDAAASLGASVVELWAEAQAITTEACQHCASGAQPQHAPA